ERLVVTIIIIVGDSSGMNTQQEHMFSQPRKSAVFFYFKSNQSSVQISICFLVTQKSYPTIG
ncbi:MAG: hypothetical protein WBB56_06510, partial [Psychrobacillus psychrotolerans]